MPLGHLGVNVASLPRAKSFYDTIMPMVEFEPFISSDTQFSYRPAEGKVGTWIFFYGALEEGTHSRHRPGLQHLAFIVRTYAAVHAAYSKALELGAEVVHEPREWPEYHPGYYAAFVQDLDGFMVEFVCHRDEDQ
jgi:catechol 2,3-dioxygenase-like lactoylglutathione lyase family enzyme